MKIPLFHVDAFTDHLVSGNPAAVCLLDSWLDDAQLRKVAAENNLPATAFLVPATNGYSLRWFTGVSELKLCGHATFASGYVVLNRLRPELDSVRFSTQSRGDLTVRKEGDCLAMDFPALVAKSCATVPAVIRALGPTLRPGDIVEMLEVFGIYITVLSSQSAVRNLHPDQVLLEKLHPSTVSVTAAGEDSDFVSRYFAPGYGIPEDSVTGSAHAALAPYWAGRTGKTQLHARQLSPRGGEVWCELAGDRVILKGRAVYFMEGSLTI
jgi:PhzF family phenazine biosynthesis protein